MSKEERTEAPTPKRKRDAKRKGQIAKSQDLVVWAQIFVATYALGVTFSLGSSALRESMVRVYRLTANPEPDLALSFLGDALLRGVIATAPIAGAMLLTAIVGNLGQTGFALAPHKLKPSAERLSPMKGIKRIFSKQGAWEAAKEVARASILAGIAWQPLRNVTGQLVDHQGPLRDSIVTTTAACVRLARNVAFAGLVLAAADFAVQKRRIMKSLRMTKQEVKDEYRQTEGDPLVKSQRRARALEITRNRMMADVKKATAVVVNPTHVAVAIAYERSAGAPKVLAKGTGELAARIRAEAEQHKVPIVRNVVLARALNAVCEVGDHIPAELYEAVARLLAFVMSVGKRSAWAGPLVMHGPSLVPDDLAQLGDAVADGKTGARRAPRRRGQGRPRRDEAR